MIVRSKRNFIQVVIAALRESLLAIIDQPQHLSPGRLSGGRLVMTDLRPNRCN
jgi:hypothetical protein